MMERKKGMFTGRVLRDYEFQWDSPDRLNDAIMFDHALNLTQEYDKRELLQLLDLSGYKQDQKLRDVDILLANIRNADRNCLIVPLGAENWVNSQYTKASYFTVDLVHQLVNQDLILMKEAYKFENDAKYPRIYATEGLRELCPFLPDQVIYEPVNLVEVRDWKGNLLPYKETAVIDAVKKKLQAVNDVNGAADILRGPEVYQAYLVAIYKQKTTLYGRLHTRGFHHVQGLSEIKRAKLTINGDPVIELDFSALHPNLMYASVGIQYPLDKDPYKVLHKEEVARQYLKHLLLYLLNSRDFTQAERAGNYYLKQHQRERIQLEQIGITRARPLLEAYYREHEPISKYFCTGKETGLRVMNLDAQIALDIVHDFAKRGIPVLAVHDSFIVQQQHREQLRDTMLHRYSQHTKGFKINIK